MSNSEQGTCQVCGKENTGIQRTYYYYGIKCECHSPEHFEIVYHCNTCVPNPPSKTTLNLNPTTERQLLSQFTQPAGVDIHLAWQDEYNNIFYSLPKHSPEVKGYSREQVDAIKDVLIKSKGALEYAAFNYDGSKLENLRPGLLDSTGVSDSCLISVREINHLLSSLPTPSTDEGIGD